MTFTAQEVDQSVLRATDPDRDYETGWYGLYNGELSEVELDLGVVATHVADKRFGEEGSAGYDDQPIFVVIKVGEQYFQKEGVYNSWDGTGFSGGGECVEVEPVEVPLTFYRHKE